jgi:5-bromo-4-chloroindolyl phosphate hydrolysis protein
MSHNLRMKVTTKVMELMIATSSVVVQAMVKGPEKVKGRYRVLSDGGITVDAIAERFEEDLAVTLTKNEEIDHDLGCGKRRKQANRQYATQ